MKLNDVVVKYIEFKQSMGMRFRSESVMLKAFCKALGDIDITKVESESVATYLAGKGPITSFWHRKFEALNGFYRYAIGRGYVTYSPLPTMIPKRPEPFVAYIYTPEEFHRLLKATDILDVRKNHVDAVTFRTLLLLLFNTGLRISEALFLTLDDIEFSANLVTIRDTKFFKVRLVPINPRLSTVLSHYRNRRQALIRSKDKHSFFFAKPNGLALSYGCTKRAFRMLCNYSGIRRENETRYQPRLHDIRHYAEFRIMPSCLPVFDKNSHLNWLAP
jgi:integrase/recombinase XerD